MWTQNFDPVGQLALSALVAAVPIVFLFWALAVRKMKGYVAALSTTTIAVGLAMMVYGMPPGLALAATLQGVAYGLFPIGWIVITAVFLYNLTVSTGQFDIIKDSIARITEDRRLQALLIGFSFGAFLEGAAGFGTPVAISAGMLAGLGFVPMYAAGLCLIANTAPVAFGAIGVPIIVAGQVTGLDEMAISQMVGRQLPLLSVLVPFYLVLLMSGWRGLREVWPAALVSGGSFAIAQWATSNYLGPMLPDIVSSLVSIVCLVLLLRVWSPRRVFRFDGEAGSQIGTGPAAGGLVVLRAWSPFVLLTLLVGNWGLPQVKAVLDTVAVKIPVPLLHNAVVSPTTGNPIAAVYTFNWLSAAGTAILISALLSAVVMRVPAGQAARIFTRTLRSLLFPLVTIGAVLGLAYIGNASGMMTTLGLTLAATGALFPFFSPWLGWLGVFITGSDTSANAVFGKLQAVTAERLGLDPVLTVAANSSGGVTGKMISPQSIAVACAATGLVGRESQLFRFTVGHSLVFVTVIGIVTWLQATVFTWMIPHSRGAAAVATAAATGTTGLALLATTAVIVLALVFVVRVGDGEPLPVPVVGPDVEPEG